MPRPETHPLYDVAAADPERLQLFVSPHGGVRIEDREINLWIKLKSDPGSINDRWAFDEQMAMVSLSDETVAGGTDAILAAIAQTRLTADENRPPPSFRVIRDTPPETGA